MRQWKGKVGVRGKIRRAVRFAVYVASVQR